MLEDKRTIKERKARKYIVYVYDVLGKWLGFEDYKHLSVFMGVNKENLEWTEILMELVEIKCRW